DGKPLLVTVGLGENRHVISSDRISYGRDTKKISGLEWGDDRDDGRKHVSERLSVHHRLGPGPVFNDNKGNRNLGGGGGGGGKKFPMKRGGRGPAGGGRDGGNNNRMKNY
ncbi:unnamed protein product, partial [Meganyctiphanes norvegica]